MANLNTDPIPEGTPVYAVCDRPTLKQRRHMPGYWEAVSLQNTVRGVMGQRYGAFCTILTDLGRGVTRRRLYHSRYVTVDLWAKIADLP